MKKSGLSGTEIEHRRDAIKSLALARELTKEAARYYKNGHCAKAIESLDSASFYLGEAQMSSGWTTDKPLRRNSSAVGKAQTAVLKLILAKCVRPTVVK
jgi:hypothetical protein